MPQKRMMSELNKQMAEYLASYYPERQHGLLSKCSKLPLLKQSNLAFKRYRFQSFVAESSLSCLVSFQAAAFSADDIKTGSAPKRNISVELDNAMIKTQAEPSIREPGQEVDLNAAKVIVGIGRGMAKDEYLPLVRSLADALGARVYRNHYREIGWHPVSLTEAAKDSQIFSHLPQTFTPFLWHEYAFEIPSGCVRLAESEGCANQAFECGGRLIGLQFHIEPSTESLQRVLACCGDKIGKGRYVQSSDEILNNKNNLGGLRTVMTLLLEGLERICRAG